MPYDIFAKRGTEEDAGSALRKKKTGLDGGKTRRPLPKYPGKTSPEGKLDTEAKRRTETLDRLMGDKEGQVVPPKLLSGASAAQKRSLFRSRAAQMDIMAKHRDDGGDEGGGS